MHRPIRVRSKHKFNKKAVKGVSGWVTWYSVASAKWTSTVGTLHAAFGSSSYVWMPDINLGTPNFSSFKFKAATLLRPDRFIMFHHDLSAKRPPMSLQSEQVAKTLEVLLRTFGDIVSSKPNTRSNKLNVPVFPTLHGSHSHPSFSCSPGNASARGKPQLMPQSLQTSQFWRW